MPLLDVSFILDDPLLSDTFSLTRRAETIGDNGRVTVVTTVFNDLHGVVTQQDPASIMKQQEGQYVPRSIFVATRFRARNASVGYQPDVITWAGEEYFVKQVLPYSRYGAGFCEIIASTQAATDQPQ